MRKKILTAVVAFAALTVTTQAQKLDKFGADMGKKSLMGKDIRIPYTDMTSYYGFIKPGTKPDEERGGKKYYYLYVWIPAVAPEIGIRMVSPVSEKMAPSEGDMVSPEYKANEADKTSYFDTWISFERALDVVSAADAATKGKTAKWVSYGNNDDSGEMPAQPSGSKYNSLMRITSNTSDPLKSLVAGLYRIGFTTYKTGDVQGSFLAQVGAPIKLPGVKVAKTLEEISK